MNSTENVVTSTETDDVVSYPIINVDEFEYCKLKVHYEADPDVIASKRDEAVAALRKVRVPGYRPGKAPDIAIKLKLKKEIDNFVARSMTMQVIDDVVFETDIKPIGFPRFSDIKVKNKTFKCDFELMRRPEFEVGDIKFEIPKPHIELDASQLAEKSLFDLRMRHGDVFPYEEEDFVEMGDQITFSFRALIDGEPFEGSIAEGELYEVGQGRWNGLDENLIGMKAGESRIFDLTFDESSEDLNGKTASVNVTVHMGTKRKPHPLNDEFCSKLGIEDVPSLMKHLQAAANNSIDHQRKDSIRSQVGIKLIENTPFEVPDFLVKEELNNIISNFAQSNLPIEMINKDDKLKEQAQRNVKLSLILDAIREKEPDSVLSNSEAQTQLFKHIQSRGQDPSALFGNKAMAPRLSMMIGVIKDEFTLQWVADQAVLVE